MASPRLLVSPGVMKPSSAPTPSASGNSSVKSCKWTS